MNCKPGDLAFIVVGHNRGHIVEVLSAAGEFNGDAVWNVRAPRKLPSFWNGDPGRPGGDVMEGQARDRNLRPISGVPVTDDVEDEVVA